MVGRLHGFHSMFQPDSCYSGVKEITRATEKALLPQGQVVQTVILSYHPAIVLRMSMALLDERGNGMDGGGGIWDMH